MEINLLYFDGCPSWERALDNLYAALTREGISAVINLIKVEDEETAAKMKFLGSPSFQVGGIDLWPEERSSYILSCRIYSTPFVIQGFPTIEMLCEKFHTSITENNR